MIRYDLMDKDGNVYELNGTSGNPVAKGSMTSPTDNFTIENKLKERSAGPGSVALGESRIKSRKIDLMYTRTESVSTDYTQQENELISFLPSVTYLVDQTNLRRIDAKVLSHKLKYITGNHKLMGEGTIALSMLRPFWEDLTETEVTGSILGGIEEGLSFTVGGYYEVQPVIEVTASSACPLLDIYLDTVNPNDKVGINIADPLFGTVGYETITIDCYEGTLLIGDIDRTQNIEEGTGFFNVPVGPANIVFQATENIDISIKFRERYFI